MRSLMCLRRKERREKNVNYTESKRKIFRHHTVKLTVGIFSHRVHFILKQPRAIEFSSAIILALLEILFLSRALQQSHWNHKDGWEKQKNEIAVNVIGTIAPVHITSYTRHFNSRVLVLLKLTSVVFTTNLPAHSIPIGFIFHCKEQAADFYFKKAFKMIPIRVDVTQTGRTPPKRARSSGDQSLQVWNDCYE